MYHTIDDVRGAERIDSRDLIELRDQLRGELEAIVEDGTPSDEREDLTEGIAAIDELEAWGIVEWDWGALLIREDTFEDYARDLAEDLGALSSTDQWPLMHIDWEAAAQSLRQDYDEVTFLGYDYLVRS